MRLTNDHKSALDSDPALMDLYKRIIDFQIDNKSDDFQFTQRLARDNGWSIHFSHRVIEEYKRFLLLLAAAGHPVTPSDQVDQAWHLHLTYSKSYWDSLCGKVIGKALHHNPTRGGREESLKFDQWYCNTLKSYERIFGYPPPPDIWPDPSIRFGDDLHFKRINTRRNWIFRNPLRNRWSADKRYAFVGMIGLLAGFVVFIADDSDLELISAGINFNFDADGDIGAHFGVLIFIIVFFISIFYLISSGMKAPNCPKCRKREALKPCGYKDVRKNEENNRYEYRCKHCRHWVLMPESDSPAKCHFCGQIESINLEDSRKDLSGNCEGYECKNCGYQIWRKERSSSGAGGCGGIGGDGDGDGCGGCGG